MTGKVICFGNFKGGVGKSTLISMVAGYFHANGGRVIAVDSDDLQNTLAALHADKGTPYPVLQVSPLTLAGLLESLRREYAYIFVDLPRNLAQNGVAATYAQVDYLFIPMCPTSLDVDSTLSYIEFVNKTLRPAKEGSPIAVYSLFNRVVSGTREHHMLTERQVEIGVPILQHFLKESVAVQRNAGMAASSDAQDLCKEVWEIVNSN